MRSPTGAFKSFSARASSSRAANFYFRRVIPRDLREAFGRTEIRFSLRTGDQRTAYQRWLMSSFLWLQVIDEIREKMNMGKPPNIDELVAGLRAGAFPQKLEIDRYNPHKVHITFDLREESLEDVATGLMALVRGGVDVPQAVETPADSGTAVGRGPNSATTSVTTLRPVASTNPPSQLLEFKDVAAKYQAVREAGWDEGTRDQYRAIFDTVSELLSGVPFRAIDEMRMAEVKRKLLMLPARRRILPRFRDLCVSQVLELQEDMARTGTTIETLAAGTFNNYWAQIEGLFKWSVGKYTDKNYAAGMKIAVKTGGRRKNKARRAFDHADLRAIFETGAFEPGGYRYDFQYWGPVASHYLGARVSEVGAIPVVAVKRSPLGTVYIELFEEHGFAPKTVWGERRIPVHRDIAEQLWQLAERRRAKGERYLLSCMYDGQPDPGRTISRFVNEDLLPRVGVKNKQKVEHSFRHGFINLCRDFQVDGGYIDELVGHTPDTTKGQNYEELTDIETLARAINSVDFIVRVPPYQYAPHMDRPRRKKATQIASTRRDGSGFPGP